MQLLSEFFVFFVWPLKKNIWCNFHKMKKKLDYLLVCLYCFTGSSPQSYCHTMKKKLDYYLCLVNKKLPQFCSSPKGKKKERKNYWMHPLGEEVNYWMNNLYHNLLKTTAYSNHFFFLRNDSSPLLWWRIDDYWTLVHHGTYQITTAKYLPYGSTVKQKSDWKQWAKG